MGDLRNLYKTRKETTFGDLGLDRRLVLTLPNRERKAPFFVRKFPGYARSSFW
jgi:hypothetical protein